MKYKEKKAIQEEQKLKRNIILVGILILITLGVFLGTSYAVFSMIVEGNKKITIEAGTFKIDFNDSQYIRLNDIGSMTNQDGRKTTPYKFTIHNEGNMDAYYSIRLIEEGPYDDKPLINTSYLDYEIKGTDGSRKEGNIKELKYFFRDKYLESEEEITYELRIWVDKDVPNSEQGKSYQSKVEVSSSQVESGEPQEPVLSNNMIPVVYDGTWKKADINKSWYDYSKQEWANAVITTQETRDKYKSDTPGTTIEMNDILQMYVWIPRYSYTIKSEDGKNYYGKKEEGREDNPSQASPGEIDVKFIGPTTKDEGSAKYTGTVANGWFTPPGFTFGKEELSGVWVGKFETGYSSEAGTGKSVDNVTLARVDQVKPNNVIIKPNVHSWRYIRVSTLDLVARGMNDSDNIYGFDESTIDTHAMKDSEWALITYLTQSKYGKYGNKLYDGVNKQVYMNNYNGFKTGCSSGIPTASSVDSCTNEYDVIADRGSGTGQAGGGSSSTGNITGIYDINGGTYEYTMGNYNKYSGYTSKAYNAEESETLGRPKAEGAAGLWNSGYTGKTGLDNLTYQGLPWPEDKYYNLYTTDDMSTICGGQQCKGNALGEVERWYGDGFRMVDAQYPWSLRGGYHGSGAGSGVFYLHYNYGRADDFVSFRIVLTT